jgi:hypothetical protein
MLPSSRQSSKVLVQAASVPVLPLPRHNPFVVNENASGDFEVDIHHSARAIGSCEPPWRVSKPISGTGPSLILMKKERVTIRFFMDVFGMIALVL